MEKKVHGMRPKFYDQGVVQERTEETIKTKGGSSGESKCKCSAVEAIPQAKEILSKRRLRALFGDILEDDRKEGRRG